jgi:hypothetical protein
MAGSGCWAGIPGAPHQQLRSLLLPALGARPARCQPVRPVLQLRCPGRGGHQAALQLGHLLVALAQLAAQLRSLRAQVRQPPRLLLGCRKGEGEGGAALEAPGGGRHAAHNKQQRPRCVGSWQQRAARSGVPQTGMPTALQAPQPGPAHPGQARPPAAALSLRSTPSNRCASEGSWPAASCSRRPTSAPCRPQEVG